jgi:hypothetical protein
MSKDNVKRNLHKSSPLESGTYGAIREAKEKLQRAKGQLWSLERAIRELERENNKLSATQN